MNTSYNVNKIIVLVLEDSKTQLLKIKYILESGGFYVIPFENPVQALNYLTHEDCILPNIILSDITMPEMDGYEFCKHVKNNVILKEIPFIFLTALTSDHNQSKGLDLGAIDYIFKPVNPELIKKRIKAHCELKMHQDHLEEMINTKVDELELVQQITIECIANLAEHRDNDTGAHIKRTKLYVKTIAEELRKNPKYSKYLTDKHLKLLVLSAPLHDIGKVGIPDSILLKPGKLTKEEFEIMKKHTTIGKKTLEIADKMMNNNSFLHSAIELTEYHHEKWNGTGYPLGLKGDKIPLFARLMAIADVFDALISKRVYKKAGTFEDAIEIITKGSGTHFDPDIVQAFLNVEDQIKDISYKYNDMTED